MNEASRPESSEIVHGGLTLAQVAELSAIARLASPPFAEVLASRGLSNEAWNDARNAWNRAIEEELERGGEGLVVAFAEALAEAKERVRREPPTLGDRSPQVVASTERGAFQASFQRAGVSPTHDAQIFGRPSYEKASLDRSGSPRAEPPKVAYLEPEAPPLDTTARMPIQAIAQRILPFQAAPPGQAPSAAQAPSPASDAAKPRPSSLGSTAPLSMPRVLPKPLPFKTQEPARSPSQPGAAAPALPSSGQAPSAQPSSPPPSAPSSSRSGSAPQAPRLSPEQYASLTAELAERPERAVEVRARYLVTQDAAWTALQAEWQQRMTADPRLRQRITDLVAHYRGFFKRSGG